MNVSIPFKIGKLMLDAIFPGLVFNRNIMYFGTTMSGH